MEKEIKKLNLDLVKMSPKGQLVVPQDIREREDFKSGERFIAFPVKEGVFFKRIKFDVKVEFERLSKDIERQFKRQKIKRSDVIEAIKWSKR